MRSRNSVNRRTASTSEARCCRRSRELLKSLSSGEKGLWISSPNCLEFLKQTRACSAYETRLFCGTFSSSTPSRSGLKILTSLASRGLKQLGASAQVLVLRKRRKSPKTLSTALHHSDASSDATGGHTVCNISGEVM